MRFGGSLFYPDGGIKGKLAELLFLVFVYFIIIFNKLFPGREAKD